jgi:hypothetical protein
MNGGEISGNTADSQGGGVYILDASDLFDVASAAVKANIKNNTVTSGNPADGPQVYADGIGSFTVGGVPAGTY